MLIAVRRRVEWKKSAQHPRRYRTLFRLRKNRKEKKARTSEGSFQKNFADLSGQEPEPEFEIQEPSDASSSENRENDEFAELLLTGHYSLEVPFGETSAEDTDLNEGGVSTRSSVDSVSASILRLILNHAGYLRRTNRNKDAALHVAVKWDLLESIRLFLQMGANVHSVNRKGETLLHVAAMNGSADALTVLLKAGASVNAVDLSNESTPLDYAIDKVEIHGASFLTAARTLVNYGATISHWNTQKLERMCAKAIVNGVEGLVGLYLDSGCSPNARENEHGLSLLAVAAKFGKVDIGKLLLKRGAIADENPSVLFTASANNRPHFVDFLLKQEREISSLRLDKRRCLRIAALATDMDSESRKTMISVLLQNGIDINIEMDSSCNTVLHEAVQIDKLEVIQTLVELGADVNARSRNGSTPLMLAARAGNIEAAQLLIRKAKAAVGCRRNDGSHALHMAIAAGRTVMVQYLLAEGAPMNLARDDGVTPLRLAVMTSSPAIVKMLLIVGADLLTIRNALIQDAIERDAVRVLELLIQFGTESCRSDPKGLPWLWSACELNKAAVVGFLLKAGIDPNVRPDAMEYPLVEAIYGGFHRVLELLLDAGADPNVKNGCGIPATILAFRQENFFAVHALVNSGKADLSSTTADGSHLLHEAVCCRDEALVSFLLSKRAPVDQVGACGQTPLKQAVVMSDRVITKMLLDAGAIVSRDAGLLLASAIEKNDLETLRLLYFAGIDLDQADDEGDVPLAAACIGNKKDIVQFLLDAGAAVNNTPHETKKPLMTAILAKADCSAIEMLLNGGAYPNIFDDEGNTALHIAIRDGDIELVRLLLEHGADQFIRNARMLSARQFAHCLDLNEIVEVLDLHAVQQGSERRSRRSGDHTDKQRVSTEQFLTAVEDMFVCPITMEIMQDPVLASDGHCYERSAITSWLRTNGKSPMTRRQMSIQKLLPNVPLKRQIELFQQTRRQ